MSAASCANSDIAGPGVVASFIIAAVFTTACSIAAAVLDGMRLDETAILPLRIQVWLNRNISHKAEETILLWRETLDRLILSLADQQLVTGVCLLLSGVLYTVTPSDDATGGTTNANFTMIISLACLASSSHLASLITLQKYFKKHPVSAYVRAVCIVIFAFGLTSCILVDMKSPFSQAFYLILKNVYNDIVNYAPFSDDVLFGGILLYTFYIAVIQLFVGLRTRIAKTVRLVWKVTKRHVIYNRATKHLYPRVIEKPPLEKPSRSKRTLKKIIWFIILGSSFEAFILQVCFATTSLVLLLLVRFSAVFTTCFVDDQDNNSWGFGQTLPMFLLLLPFLTTLEFYFESKKALNEESEEKELRARALCGGCNDALWRVSLPPPVLLRTDSNSTCTTESGLTHFNEHMHNYQHRPGAGANCREDVV